MKTDEKPPENGDRVGGRGLFRLDEVDWLRLRGLKWVPISAAAVAVLVVWIQIFIHPRGDFPLHWELGRRLAAGTFIYEGGLDFVYPPFWAMVHAPLEIFGVHLAQALIYPFGVLVTAALILVLRKLSEPRLPLSPDASFWCAWLAIFLASLFIIRDLPEVCVNTALVAMSWGSIYLWSKRRDVAGGIMLGCAAALKCTPLMFVAWFCLKRQWKMAMAASAAFALFSLSPMLVSGPARYVHMMESWIQGVVRGFADPDPSHGPLGEEKVENLSLRPALARYLMSLPYGHKGRPETTETREMPNDPPQPLYFQFLDLSPERAGLVVRITMAALMLAMIWVMRHKPEDRGSPALLWEAAAVSILILLFSPITWGQHSVGVLPALYLICRAALSRWTFPRWMQAAMGIYTLFCLIMSRALFGRDLIKLANSYRVKTIGFLLLLIVVIGCIRRISSRSKHEENPDQVLAHAVSKPAG